MKLSKNGLAPQQEDDDRFNQPMTVIGLKDRSLKKTNQMKEWLMNFPLNFTFVLALWSVVLELYKKMYSGVPNKHTRMLIYFGQKCMVVLNCYYFENIIAITLLLINRIQIMFLVCTIHSKSFHLIIISLFYDFSLNF